MNIKITLLVACMTAFGCAQQPVYSPVESTKQHDYEVVNFVERSDSSVIYVYFDQRPSTATIDRVLRAELQRLVDDRQPTKWISIYAWYRSPTYTYGNAEQLHLSDGSVSLKFDPESRRIATSKQLGGAL